MSMRVSRNKVPALASGRRSRTCLTFNPKCSAHCARPAFVQYGYRIRVIAQYGQLMAINPSKNAFSSNFGEDPEDPSPFLIIKAGVGSPTLLSVIE